MWRVTVVAGAAEALRARGEAPDLGRLRAAAASPGAPDRLLRALAAAHPAAPEVARAARAGAAAGLDHVADPAALRALLEGPHRAEAAWQVARLGALPAPELAALAADGDPRVRAAAARGLPAAHPALAALEGDPDPGVRWLAARARAGAFAPGATAARLAAHARAGAPSTRPPYGLRPGDVPAGVPRVDAALALCGVGQGVNVGVAVRSAEAAGLAEVLVVGRGFRTDAAQGADAALPVRALPDEAALLRLARARGWQLVAVQQTPASEPYHRAAYPPRPCFLLGAEGAGLSPALRAAADLAVEIPLFGVIDSLNVAAAATCVVFHWRLTAAAAP